MDAVQIGNLLAIAGAFSVIGALPTGFASDRFGRKRLLAFGLMGTAVATYLMAGTTGFGSAVVAVIAFGLTEAVVLGTNQVYAMDLAPEDRRGAFLGVWTLFTNLGQITGPLVIGSLADAFGFSVAFTVVAVAVALGAAAVLALGTETRRAPERSG